MSRLVVAVVVAALAAVVVVVVAVVDGVVACLIGTEWLVVFVASQARPSFWPCEWQEYQACTVLFEI